MNRARSNSKSKIKFVYSDNDSLSVIFQDNALLMGVVGEFNENLKELEKLTATNLYFRGNSIIIKSDQKNNEIVKNAIMFLSDQFINNGTIEKKDILSSTNKFMISENSNTGQKIEYIIKTPKKSVIPRSEKQKKYVRALKESDIIISTGPAGTGKTFLAVAVGLTMLLEKKIERIILSRPAVEAGERLGFLPGDMKEKVDPYMQPLYDALNEFLPHKILSKMHERNSIEIAPLAFMRGRTLKNAFVVLDEAQNSSTSQMKMFLTRLGMGSRMVITGDITQIDLPRGLKSGLVEAVEILTGIKEIDFIRFTGVDIVRHSLVRKIAKAYEARPAKKSIE